MELICPGTPARVDHDRMDVVLMCNAYSGDHVECRVSARVLMIHYGAKTALDDEEQLRAFEQHRETIVAAWQRNYTADMTERLNDRTVVRLHDADF